MGTVSPGKVRDRTLKSGRASRQAGQESPPPVDYAPCLEGFSFGAHGRTPDDTKCCPAAWKDRVGRPQGQKGGST
jgi:hypothetical protein